MVKSRSFQRAALVGLAIALASAPLAAAAQDRAVRTRVLAWTGGDRLFVALPADVRYVQGPAGKMVITGPTSDIDDIVVEHGVIRHERLGFRWWNWGWNWRSDPGVRIVVTAPQLNEAGVSGSGHLDLGRLAQDHLDVEISGSGALDLTGRFKSLRLSMSGSGAARLSRIDAADLSASLSGSGWIRASGAAGAVHLGISGSGAADMGDLVAQDVTANLSGSGFAKLSPKRSADLTVSGSGGIRLLTEPPSISAHRSGSGSIVHPGGSS